MVTSGYCLVVEYSLCLPSEVQAIRGKRPMDLLRTQLVESLKKVNGRNDAKVNRASDIIDIDDEDEDDGSSTFALVLSKSCDKAKIESKGVEALSGIDGERFQLLRDANGYLPLAKKCKIACLRHICAYGRGGPETQESASWYFINGKKLSDGTSIDWTKKLSFLNPDSEAFYQLNDEVLHDYGYERFAVVEWPASVDIRNTYNLMGEFAGTAAILANSPMDATKLREFVHYAAGRQMSDLTGSPPAEVYVFVSFEFCQKLCKVIVELGDLNLVAVFGDKYFPRVDKKEEVIPLFAELAHKFGWNAVSASLLGAINGMADELRMGASLQLAEALLDIPTASGDLTTFALKNVRIMFDVRPGCLASCKNLGLLWKCAMACQNPQVFRDVGNLLEAMDAKLLGPVVSALSSIVNDSPNSPERRAALSSVASRRRQWLLAEIADIEKPFTWEVVDANFPDATAISAFLRSSNDLLEIQGFRSIVDACGRAELLCKKIKAPLEIIPIQTGLTSQVNIVKTGGLFAIRSKKMTEHKAEVRRLGRLVRSDEYSVNGCTSASSSKRQREVDMDELDLT